MRKGAIEKVQIERTIRRANGGARLTTVREMLAHNHKFVNAAPPGWLTQPRCPGAHDARTIAWEWSSWAWSVTWNLLNVFLLRVGFVALADMSSYRRS